MTHDTGVTKHVVDEHTPLGRTRAQTLWGRQVGMLKQMLRTLPETMATEKLRRARLPHQGRKERKRRLRQMGVTGE